VVLEQGAIVQEIYFIASGIICMYGLDDKGSSHALQFGIPGWWLTDLNAFMNGSAAEYKIECAEHCELLALSRKDYLQLTGAISSFQIYMHQVILNKYNRAIKKIELLMCENAEDRFQKFTAAFPQFVNQVPQYILASVLGFTPQFLSMLRSRLKK
jgi:CRP-like cAMP-binding protein